MSALNDTSTPCDGNFSKLVWFFRKSPSEQRYNAIRKFNRKSSVFGKRTSFRSITHVLLLAAASSYSYSFLVNIRIKSRGMRYRVSVELLSQLIHSYVQSAITAARALGIFWGNPRLCRNWFLWGVKIFKGWKYSWGDKKIWFYWMTKYFFCMKQNLIYSQT